LRPLPNGAGKKRPRPQNGTLPAKNFKQHWSAALRADFRLLLPA
jgi:hypothetical protein